MLSSSPLPLSETDRASLQIFVHCGRANARTLTRARLLLKLGFVSSISPETIRWLLKKMA